MDVRYSKADIKEWKSKLESLPNEIKSLNNTVTENTGILTADKNQLQELIDTRIKPEKALLKQIIAKIDLLTLPEQIPPLQAKLPPLDSQIESLHEPITQTEKAVEPLKIEIRQIKLWIEIKEIQTNIHELDEKINSLMAYRNASEEDLRKARRERDNLSQSYDEIHLEVKNLLASKDKMSREIKDFTRARDDLEAEAATAKQNYYSSASGSYSSSANQGYSSSNGGGGYASSGGGTNPSGYGSSGGSSVIASSDTEIRIAEYNSKIRAKEHERNDLERFIRERQRYCSEAYARKEDAQTAVNNIETKINGYNRDIHTAENSRDSFKNKLSYFDYKDREHANTNTFESLRENLKQQENTLRPIENKLDSLLSQRGSLWRTYSSVNEHISSLERRIKECEEITKTYSSTESLEQLRQRRADQETLLAELSKKRESLENGIDRCERVIKNSNDMIDKLNREWEEKRSNQYLNNLENNPVDLFNKLALSVYQDLELFDLQHLYHQSVTVRICLAELNYKLNYILPQHHLPLMAKDCDPALARQQYYLICGLLQAELAHLNKQTDKELVQLINQLLHEHIISLKEAESDYKDFEGLHPVELPTMTDTLLLQYEIQAFENAQKDFQTSIEKLELSTSPEVIKVRKIGEDLLTRINDKRKESEKDKTKTFDNKYYSSLLAYGNKMLVTKPDDPKYMVYRQRYQQIASYHPDDRPSVWNKVGGVALMFLGAVIVAAGVLTAIFSHPFAPPLSYGIGATACATGIGKILLGIGLFRRGCRASTPEKLSAFSASTEKAGNLLTDDRDPAADGSRGAGSYGYQSAVKAV